MRNDLLMPGEVAELFAVSPKTVTRWAAEGRIPFIRTPGGHHRYPREAVMMLLRGELDAPSQGTTPGAGAPATAD